MAEDVLTMRARLFDEASGTLDKLRRNMALVSKDVDTSKARAHLGGLQNSIKGVADAISSGASGGLLGGMRAFSGGAAGFAVGLGVVGFAAVKTAQQLR